MHIRPIFFSLQDIGLIKPLKLLGKYCSLGGAEGNSIPENFGYRRTTTKFIYAPYFVQSVQLAVVWLTIVRSDW